MLIHERLCDAYGCPQPPFSGVDPLSELISSLLTHRTLNKDSHAAFKALREAYPDWAAVSDAPTGDVQRVIHRVTWPEQKAPRIQAVLRRIGEMRGELSLEFLAEVPVADARAWLEQLPGVGPKTSAAVLSFSTLRRPALPVDCHHHRVAVRLGLLPASVGEGPAHAVLAGQLPTDWDWQRVYDNHQVMMRHGQKCCFHANPACHHCPVLDLCPFGQRRTGRLNDPDAIAPGETRSEDKVGEAAQQTPGGVPQRRPASLFE